MAKINLLPWREELREQRKKQFILYCIGIGVLALLTVVFVWMIEGRKLKDQEDANKYIVSQNQVLDQKLKSLDGLQDKRKTLLDRMKLINNLDAQRTVVVHFVDELVRVTPENVYLTKFIRNGNKFTIEGFAESPDAVAKFLRQLGTSQWFRNAFMVMFQAHDDTKNKPESSLAPRKEDSYGSFVVTVDLGADAAALDTSSTETEPKKAEVKK